MCINRPVQQEADGLMHVSLLQQLQVSCVSNTKRDRWSNACQSPAAAAGKLCIVSLLQQLQVSCVSNTKRDRWF